MAREWRSGNFVHKWTPRPPGKKDLILKSEDTGGVKPALRRCAQQFTRGGAGLAGERSATLLSFFRPLLSVSVPRWEVCRCM